jgi:hypothetical protein
LIIDGIKITRPLRMGEHNMLSQGYIAVTIDKSHITTIGERLYAESIEFIRELVNNAYDADATLVFAAGSESRAFPYSPAPPRRWWSLRQSRSCWARLCRAFYRRGFCTAQRLSAWWESAFSCRQRNSIDSVRRVWRKFLVYFLPTALKNV